VGDVANIDFLTDLIDLSARIGADPLLVQGGGGNTSLKRDDVLWVKASGTWLAHARERDIFVPLPLAKVRDALRHEDGEARLAQLGSALTLRPSIETSLHALLPHPLVVHVHSVNTIAWAIRTRAQAQLAALLDGLEAGLPALGDRHGSLLPPTLGTSTQPRQAAAHYAGCANARAGGIARLNLALVRRSRRSLAHRRSLLGLARLRLRNESGIGLRRSAVLRTKRRRVTQHCGRYDENDLGN